MINEYFKRLNAWTMILVLSLGLFAVSCSEDDDPTTPSVNEAQVALEYLEGTDGGFINNSAPAIVKSTDVNTDNLLENPKFYLIDIRSAADFAKCYAANAHNVALADLLTHVQGIDAASYEKIAIICYSGQTAAYGASLLRLAGYDNVFSMKWGMSSWNSDEEGMDKWTTKTETSPFATQLETTANPTPAETYSLPTISTGNSDAMDIINARVQELLTTGFGDAVVSSADVFANPNDYFVVNYWKEAHYLDPGHVAGAYQFTPKAGFKSTENLYNLPTDQTIVVYCYTGQTSAYVAAYLKLLGYDAKSMTYGANGAFYNAMVNSGETGFALWTEDEKHTYDLVK